MCTKKIDIFFTIIPAMTNGHFFVYFFRNVPDTEPEKKATSEETEKNGRVSPAATFTKRLYIQEGPVKLSSVNIIN